MKCSSAAVIALLSIGVAQAQDPPTLPDGTTFKITVIAADGFVGKTTGNEYEGYVIDMIKTVSNAANFDFELVTPSGFGSNCSPQLDANATENVGAEVYASNYLCGQNDVLETVPTNSQTDMYWSMYFVTTSRQLAGKFSLPFKPPFGGLTMYGTATGIADIDDLVAQQKAGNQNAACVGDGTAYANFLKQALPDLKTVNVPNTDAGFLAALTDGKCEVAINAEHAANRFVKSRKASDTCKIDDAPIGVIGEGLKYGLTQMGVGFGKAMDQDVVDTISYWLNDQMTCSPGSNGCEGSLQESWIKWAGTGDECGYVGTGESSSAITITGTAAMLGLAGLVSFFM